MPVVGSFGRLSSTGLTGLCIINNRQMRTVCLMASYGEKIACHAASFCATPVLLYRIDREKITAVSLCGQKA